MSAYLRKLLSAATTFILVANLLVFPQVTLAAAVTVTASPESYTAAQDGVSATFTFTTDQAVNANDDNYIFRLNVADFEVTAVTAFSDSEDFNSGGGDNLTLVDFADLKTATSCPTTDTSGATTILYALSDTDEVAFLLCESHDGALGGGEGIESGDTISFTLTVNTPDYAQTSALTLYGGASISMSAGGGSSTLTTVNAAADRYVDTDTGSDTSTNCSNSGSPCKTIAKAIAQANADENIYVFPGTYSEALTISKAVHIQAYTGDGGTNENVILSGLGSFAASGLIFSDIQLTGTSPVSAAASSTTTFNDSIISFSGAGGCFTAVGGQATSFSITSDNETSSSTIRGCGSGRLFLGSALAITVNNTTYQTSAGTMTVPSVSSIGGGAVTFTNNTITNTVDDDGASSYFVAISDQFAAAPHPITFTGNTFNADADFAGPLGIINAGLGSETNISTLNFSNNTLNSDMVYVMNSDDNSIATLQMLNNTSTVAPPSGTQRILTLDAITAFTDGSDAVVSGNSLPATNVVFETADATSVTVKQNTFGKLFVGTDSTDTGTGTYVISRNKFTGVGGSNQTVVANGKTVSIHDNLITAGTTGNIKLTYSQIAEIFGNTIIGNAAQTMLSVNDLNTDMDILRIRNNAFLNKNESVTAISCADLSGASTVDIDYNNYDMGASATYVSGTGCEAGVNFMAQLTGFLAQFTGTVDSKTDDTISVSAGGLTGVSPDGSLVGLDEAGDGIIKYYYIYSKTDDTLTLLNLSGFGAIAGNALTITTGTLASTSALIDRGTNLTGLTTADDTPLDYAGDARSQGNAIDVGAFETAFSNEAPTVSAIAITDSGSSTSNTITWTFNDGDSGDAQTKYQVVVTAGEDSGVVESATSSYTTSTALNCGTEYEITVTVYDDNNLTGSTASTVSYSCPAAATPAGGGGAAIVNAAAVQASQTTTQTPGDSVPSESESTSEPTITSAPEPQDEPATPNLTSSPSDTSALESSGVTGQFGGNEASANQPSAVISPAPSAGLNQDINQTQQNTVQVVSEPEGLPAAPEVQSLEVLAEVAGIDLQELAAGTDTDLPSDDPRENRFSPETIVQIIAANELEFGERASNSDADEDGIPDVVERILGSDPENSDTDGDGIMDGLEVVAFNLDPNTPNQAEDFVRANFREENGTKVQVIVAVGADTDAQSVVTYVELEDGTRIPLNETVCAENGACLVDLDLTQYLGEDADVEAITISMDIKNSAGEVIAVKTKTIRLNRLTPEANPQYLAVGGVPVVDDSSVYIVRGEATVQYKTDFPTVIQTTESLVHGSFSITSARVAEIPEYIYEEPGVHTMTVTGYDPATEQYSDPAQISFVVRADYLAPLGNARLSVFETDTIIALIFVLIALGFGGQVGLKWYENRESVNTDKSA